MTTGEMEEYAILKRVFQAMGDPDNKTKVEEHQPFHHKYYRKSTSPIAGELLSGRAHFLFGLVD